MRWSRLWVVVAGCGLVNGAACSLSHSCTEIGCGSGVSVRVAPESDVWQDGTYSVELTLDDETRSCSFSVPEDLPAAGSSTSLDCGWLEQRYECTETRQGDAVSQSCQPIADQYELVLDSFGEPKTLGLVVMRGDAVLVDQSETLRYTESSPNGPDCGPVCRNAEVEATFADP